ncbi:MAG: hypothetical protein HY923_03630 [Elusimicrobia bacterium]|nr:hypothetical protein [Elusimicrobiota bacterium]
MSLAIVVAAIWNVPSAAAQTHPQAVSAENVSQAPAPFAVPVHAAAGWEKLTYRRIPPNEVVFSPAGIEIGVRASASPLIYPLPAPRRLSRVRVRLKISGSLKSAVEKGRWDEDSQFRLGLVVSGNKRLSGLSKAAAPAWVKRLFSLAPRGGGIDRIVFLMMGRSPSNIGDKRRHPSSDLIEERIAWLSDAKGVRLDLDSAVDPSLLVSALWISVDGDDTGSAYEVLIESIELD